MASTSEGKIKNRSRFLCSPNRRSARDPAPRGPTFPLASRSSCDRSRRDAPPPPSAHAWRQATASCPLLPSAATHCPKGRPPFDRPHLRSFAPLPLALLLIVHRAGQCRASVRLLVIHPK